MKTAIIALLGLTVPKTPSQYDNDTELEIVSGKYINATHALLSAGGVDRYILLGTAQSIAKQQESDVIGGLARERQAEFVETPKDDLQKIFSVTIDQLKGLEKQGYEHVVIDMTHSFRDSVMMSLMATMVSQAIYPLTISLIYAQEVKQYEHYRFKSVDEEILGAANIAMLFTTFTTTLRVPPLLTKTLIYDELSSLSNHLVSNQFKEIYDSDIPELKKTLQAYKQPLSFMGDHYTTLLKMIEEIAQTKEKKTYEQFLFFSKFFLDKSYYLQASTYLIESITYYVADILKGLGWIDFDVHDYEKQQLIVNLLKMNPKIEAFRFPNPYTLDINYQRFKEFADLRDSVAEIRHNLAHININKEYVDIDTTLPAFLKIYADLIDAGVLKELESSDARKESTVRYRLEQLNLEHRQLYGSQNDDSFTKLEKIFKKYEDGTLDQITQIDQRLSGDFCKKHRKEYQQLNKLKKNKILIISETLS